MCRVQVLLERVVVREEAVGDELRGVLDSSVQLVDQVRLEPASPKALKLLKTIGQ
jgi:hypothetical protein